MFRAIVFFVLNILTDGPATFLLLEWFEVMKLNLSILVRKPEGGSPPPPEMVCA